MLTNMIESARYIAVEEYKKVYGGDSCGNR